MTSDQERREVAENLRYLSDYPGAPVRYAEQFRDELSAVVLPDGFTHDYSELIQRLADLIEPAPSCEFWDAEEQECYSIRTAQPVDRDALLALAEEMQNQANSALLWNLRFMDVQYLIYYARRIRKALGVSDA